MLLEDGSRQEDIWGADWYPESRIGDFGALINIRPHQGNRGMEIESPKLRERIETIIRALFQVNILRDLKRMRERFIWDGSSVRLGNLASNLLRLNKWILMRHNDEAIVDLMQEIAWLMEWSGDLASAELADMQREICRWRRVWPVEEERTILALRAFQMSNRILEWSGLLDQITPEAE